MWIESIFPQCLEVFFISTSIPTTWPRHGKVERELDPFISLQFCVLFNLGEGRTNYIAITLFLMQITFKNSG